jgi:ferrochelatase
MPKFQGNQNYAHDSNTCLGVLITNLGTPDAPTTSAVRKYLAEFLWDPRVVEIPRPIWWLILHGFVLRTRPGKSVHAYEKVWTEKGSPLLAISKQQCVALQSELGKVFSGNIRVELAMRYGQPSIRSALDALQAHHVTRILVLPLYPQYSASTTASTFDAIAKYFMQLRWMPELRMVNHYGSEPAYIDACAEQLQNYWQQNKRSQKLLFSFHGLPVRNLLQGDPYHCECHQTARLIVEKLNLIDEEWEIAFQSRFGKAKWLQPYIEKRLEALPGEGIKTIDVFCPGFSADCIETLEEIDMQDRELFLQSGGQNFNYIPALNAESHHVQALVKIILKHISGWPADESSLNNSEAKLAIKERAIQLGAKQ